MPKEFSRNRRVAELLQRELAILVQRHTQNTDMGVVTVSTIDVSQDLKNAKIYIQDLEKFIQTKISSISTSPERNDTILIEDPFQN